jgi:hypothetical protein
MTGIARRWPRSSAPCLAVEAHLHRDERAELRFAEDENVVETLAMVVAEDPTQPFRRRIVGIVFSRP